MLRLPGRLQANTVSCPLLSKLLHPDRASSLRRNNLHDPRALHQINRRGQALYIVTSDTVIKFFLLCDFFCFALQAGGRHISDLWSHGRANVACRGKSDGNRDDESDSLTAKSGNNMILAGVSLQLLWFVFFIIVAAFFHYRIRLYPTMIAQHRPEIRRQRYLGSPYFVSYTIGFPTCGVCRGYNGYLQSQEIFFYVFD